MSLQSPTPYLVVIFQFWIFIWFAKGRERTSVSQVTIEKVYGRTCNGFYVPYIMAFTDVHAMGFMFHTSRPLRTYMQWVLCSIHHGLLLAVHS